MERNAWSLLTSLVLLGTPVLVLGQGVGIGDKIPEFHLVDQSGASKTFETIRGPKGAMLVFHRSADWCSFCKTQLVEIEQSREALKQRGLGVAAISYDSVGVLKHFAERKRISFPLLSDEDSTAIQAFGILNDEVPRTSEFYGIPHPVTYIVDQLGVVRSRTVEKDFSKRLTLGNQLDRRVDPEFIPAKRLKMTRSATDAVVHGGQRLKLRLELELPPNSHVYAPGVVGYIPVEWKLADTPGLELLPMQYPAAKTLHLKAIDETVPTYDGKVTLEREVVVAQKPPTTEIRVEGSLRYQVCDDKQCYIPETVPVAWNFRFQPHDTVRAPVEIRRKAR